MQLQEIYINQSKTQKKIDINIMQKTATVMDTDHIDNTHMQHYTAYHMRNNCDNVFSLNSLLCLHLSL